MPFQLPDDIIRIIYILNRPILPCELQSEIREYYIRPWKRVKESVHLYPCNGNGWKPWKAYRIPIPDLDYNLYSGICSVCYFGSVDVWLPNVKYVDTFVMKYGRFPVRTFATIEKSSNKHAQKNVCTII